jgi:hypothetical protein
MALMNIDDWIVGWLDDHIDDMKDNTDNTHMNEKELYEQIVGGQDE